MRIKDVSQKSIIESYNKEKQLLIIMGSIQKWLILLYVNSLHKKYFGSIIVNIFVFFPILLMRNCRKVVLSYTRLTLNHKHDIDVIDVGNGLIFKPKTSNDSP